MRSAREVTTLQQQLTRKESAHSALIYVSVKSVKTEIKLN